ncbi:hypothetical protein EKO04_006331 [Ascochyta lentis]|uniref:Uncharacterized protein n=1 Tax=Ascochyta lentis TaxID=205686 RepID=A0A8H7IZT9_9PLEO|nr:hypothetical protein EKO04_006331 [Ascochyta lentis]
MKSSHVFGTKSIPMKKSKGSKNRKTTTPVFRGMLQRSVGSTPGKETKQYSRTCSDPATMRAKTTSVSQMVTLAVKLDPPVTAEPATIAALDKKEISSLDLDAECTTHTSLQRVSNISPEESVFSKVGFIRSNDASSASSNDVGTSLPTPLRSISGEAGSYVRNMHDNGVTITGIIEPSTTALLPRLKSTSSFPGLAILPPARLYSEYQAPTTSRVPFGKDENQLQAHARHAFLRNPAIMPMTSRGEDGGIRRVGTAMKQLGHSRMFESLFSFHADLRSSIPQTNSLMSNPSAALDVSELKLTLNNSPGSGSNANDQSCSVITQSSSPDMGALACD